jgi:glycosyltransferase involved in cell wall biosynthesis
VSRGTIPVSVIVLTMNEARNLSECLRSVLWAGEIVVVDSGSTDGTDAIARAAGAAFVTHPFESHTRQWQWALGSVPLAYPWVLAIDADQRVSVELAASMAKALSSSTDSGPSGYFVNRRQIFRGRWIRHGGYYPKYLLKLFRRDAVALDASELVDHHFQVAGRTARLDGDLVEDNRNEAQIADWIAKHNHYARLQAREEIARAGVARRALPRSGPDARTARMKSIWARLPRYVRPSAYFFYRYVLRLGFLDGRQGFVFHALQGFWYRLLVDINIDEILSAEAPAPDAPAAPVPSATHLES